MPIVNTRHLFEEESKRLQLACELVKKIFPGAPPEAVEYELIRQGLLQKGRLSLSLDVWQLVERQFRKLILDWAGPDIPIYIFPITNGFEKNGIAYREGILLFISENLTVKELQSLFTHEYHHMCRRLIIDEHPTLMDSLVMEGLAEDAIENLFGKEYLSDWTQYYSLTEVQNYWESNFVPALYQKGLHLHKPFLFGDDSLKLPPWIGYCTGYRIIKAFKERCGPFSIEELMQINAEDIIDGAGFRRN